jgi:long-chain fatty acid transport protein
MRKSLVVVLLLLLCAPLTFATLVTNMNQSGLYFRLLSRNASTDVDSVFYNPAGTARLAEGWHFSLSNQTIFQTKTVDNTWAGLNTHEYEGRVNVPVFPDLYAAFKTGKLAISFGLGPNSGGGTADFDKGLPSFEAEYSVLRMIFFLAGFGTSEYDLKMAFEGRSTYWGFQLNAAYELADFLDAAVGARFIVAHNSYTGSITDFRLNFFGGPLLNAYQTFTAAGLPVLAEACADRAVDAAQNGTAITPIVSLNFHPADGLNFGIKYEFVTKLDLTNETTTDDVGLFPDGYKFESDIPAILSLGVEVRPPSLSRLMGTVSFNYFFDKQATWEDDRQDFIDSNSWDLGAGLEYGLTESLAVSAGFLHTQYNLLPEFNSDFSHEMSNNSVGFGGRYTVSPKFSIDLGALFTFYNASQKTIDYYLLGLVPIGSGVESYKRNTFAFSIGLNYHII